MSGDTGGNVGNGGVPALPEQVEDYQHDGAPAGAWFSDSELPVVAVQGGPPATTGGYSPDPGQTPMVSTVEDPMGLSYLKAPEGIRK